MGAKNYKLKEHKSVGKKLEKVPKPIKTKYKALKNKLKIDPYACVDEKLKKFKTPVFKHRIGAYRVIFSINDSEVTVFILQLMDRKEDYKDKQ